MHATSCLMSPPVATPRPHGGPWGCSSAPLAQLPHLMGQDARQQSRAGHESQAKSLKKGEGVELEPVLRDSSVDEAVELQAGEGDLPLGRRKPLKLPRVGAFKVDTLCAKVPFPHRVLHGDSQIRETLNESG